MSLNEGIKMTQQEIIEGNKLIAEFMGTSADKVRLLVASVHPKKCALKYHSS